MYQYQLQRYSGVNSKHRCPQCQHRQKTFKLYINTQTNQPLNPAVSMCDRLDKCGYHYTPKQYFVDKGEGVAHSRLTIVRSNINKTISPLPQIHRPSTIDNGLFKGSLSRYEQNHFVAFLRLLFGDDTTSKLIERYYIGTSKHWYGATVFWQVDINGQVRAGKVMLYNVTNAKRVKLPFNHITWVHTVLKLPGFNINQCLFGEHLLTDTSKPVAIVESEKTAIIASVYMPAYIWIATGGLSNLTPQKCSILQGRKVYLYPDVNAFDAWQLKVTELTLITDVVLFSFLEQTAGDVYRAEGLDIADYLMGLWPL